MIAAFSSKTAVLPVQKNAGKPAIIINI